MYRQFQQNRDAARAERQMEDLVSKARSAIDSIDPVFPTDLIVTDCLGASPLWDTVFRCQWKDNDDIGLDGGSESQDDTLNGIMVGRLATAPDTAPQILDSDTSCNWVCPWLASAELSAKLSANCYSDGSMDQWCDIVAARLGDSGF
ncbi:hypothetical protein DL769_008715 [Monosporascus sp. CRB-8-3]|nr:hypothetical protein DL769_008715 [Monosporascus sp. CRB-8-3]